MKKTILFILLCGAIVLSIIGCGISKNNFEVGGKSNMKLTNEEVSLSIKEGTLTNKGATLILKNNGTMDYEYDESYEIEIKQNGDWHKINVELNVNSPSYDLKVGETREIDLNWKNGYGKLSSGTYRIIKFMNYKNEENKYQLFNIAVEFTIE